MVLRLIVAVVLIFSCAGVTASAGEHDAFTIRNWFLQQRIVRCFPGFAGPDIFKPMISRPSAVPAADIIPVNPIPLSARHDPDTRTLENYVVLRNGANASEHLLAAAFDPDVSEVALLDEYPELWSFLLFGHTDATPPLVRRAMLDITIGGLGIGSQERDVDRFFGYAMGKAKGLTRCGMTAQAFDTAEPGFGFGYTFVFRNREVVAFGAGGGS